MKYERKFIYLCLILIICFTGCKNNAQQVTLTTEQTAQQIQSNESTTIQQEESTTSEINYEDLSVDKLEELANKGDAKAQFQLGYLYGLGEKVKYNGRKSIKWYTKSAEQGYAPAQSKLGLRYLKGLIVKQDYQKAFDLFTKAAEQGDYLSQYCLGYIYFYGKGVKGDDQKAIEWYTKSAEQGYDSAQYNLGFMYERGIGVDKSYEKAIEWYTKAAEQGNEEAKQSLEYIKDENPELFEPSISETTPETSSEPVIIDYSIIEEEDVSIGGNTIRKSLRILVNNADTLKQKDIEDICKTIVEDYTATTKVCALTLFLYDDIRDKDGAFTLGKCEYYPKGDIAEAVNVTAGDYSTFTYNFTINERDASKKPTDIQFEIYYYLMDSLEADNRGTPESEDECKKLTAEHFGITVEEVDNTFIKVLGYKLYGGI